MLRSWRGPASGDFEAAQLLVSDGTNLVLYDGKTGAVLGQPMPIRGRLLGLFAPMLASGFGGEAGNYIVVTTTHVARLPARPNARPDWRPAPCGTVRAVHHLQHLGGEVLLEAADGSFWSAGGVRGRRKYTDELHYPRLHPGRALARRNQPRPRAPRRSQGAVACAWHALGMSPLVAEQAGRLVLLAAVGGIDLHNLATGAEVAHLPGDQAVDGPAPQPGRPQVADPPVRRPPCRHGGRTTRCRASAWPASGASPTAARSRRRWPAPAGRSRAGGHRVVVAVGAGPTTEAIDLGTGEAQAAGPGVTPNWEFEAILFQANGERKLDPQPVVSPDGRRLAVFGRAGACTSTNG